MPFPPFIAPCGHPGEHLGFGSYIRCNSGCDSVKVKQAEPVKQEKLDFNKVLGHIVAYKGKVPNLVCTHPQDINRAKRPYKCNKCNYIFASLLVCSHSGGFWRNKANGQYTCKVCGGRSGLTFPFNPKGQPVEEF